MHMKTLNQHLISVMNHVSRNTLSQRFNYFSGIKILQQFEHAHVCNVLLLPTEFYLFINKTKKIFAFNDFSYKITLKTNL